MNVHEFQWYMYYTGGPPPITEKDTEAMRKGSEIHKKFEKEMGV